MLFMKDVIHKVTKSCDPDEPEEGWEESWPGLPTIKKLKSHKKHFWLSIYHSTLFDSFRSHHGDISSNFDK